MDSEMHRNFNLLAWQNWSWISVFNHNLLRPYADFYHNSTFDKFATVMSWKHIVLNLFSKFVCTRSFLEQNNAKRDKRDASQPIFLYKWGALPYRGHKHLNHIHPTKLINGTGFNSRICSRLGHFSNPSVKLKNIYTLKMLRVSSDFFCLLGWRLAKHEVEKSHTLGWLLIICEIKKIFITKDDCWFSLPIEIFKPKGQIFFCASLK